MNWIIQFCSGKSYSFLSVDVQNHHNMPWNQTQTPRRFARCSLWPGFSALHFSWCLRGHIKPMLSLVSLDWKKPRLNDVWAITKMENRIKHFDGFRSNPSMKFFLLVHLWDLCCLWTKQHSCTFVGAVKQHSAFRWVSAFIPVFECCRSSTYFFLEPLIPRFTRCTYGKISFPTSSQWKRSLMDSLIISSRTLPREVCVLWVNMSVVTSAKWRSIIFSPQPQKWLPWQRHFAIPQYPEIAEYSLYLLLKMPCQHMVLEPRCFITSCLLLSLEKVLWLVSSVQLTFSSELLCIVLCFEKGNRGKNSDLALVLWFYESEIYSPASLLEDWLKTTSLWTLFQTSWL